MPKLTTALLVIDVQQGLCEGEYAAFEAAEVIGRINQVSAKVRAAGGIVVFIQQESKSGPLEVGADSWRLARGLQIEDADFRVRKTTPDSFHHTDLEQMLKGHAVSEIVVCGLHTEFCVDTTTRRALALGFPVILVGDGHTSMGNQHLSAPQVIQHHNETLSNIRSFGPRVRVISAQDLRVTTA